MGNYSRQLSEADSRVSAFQYARIQVVRIQFAPDSRVSGSLFLLFGQILWFLIAKANAFASWHDKTHISVTFVLDLLIFHMSAQCRFVIRLRHMGPTPAPKAFSFCNDH